jgi:hypothetical protein
MYARALNVAVANENLGAVNPGRMSMRPYGACNIHQKWWRTLIE